MAEQPAIDPMHQFMIHKIVQGPVFQLGGLPVDMSITNSVASMLAGAVILVAFILLTATRGALSRPAVLVLMLFCLAMLAGGVLSPMLEVEVRVTRLDATLLGAPVEFRDQSLYYRSKTVLEVSRTLLEMHRPAMSLVAILVILFSVVFPVLKMLALSASLFRPSLLRNSRVVRILAFELSKWSMADVMVLAIFMSFIASCTRVSLPKNTTSAIVPSTKPLRGSTRRGASGRTSSVWRAAEAAPFPFVAFIVFIAFIAFIGNGMRPPAASRIVRADTEAPSSNFDSDRTTTLVKVRWIS